LLSGCGRRTIPRNLLDFFSLAIEEDYDSSVGLPIRGAFDRATALSPAMNALNVGATSYFGEYEVGPHPRQRALHGG